MPQITVSARNQVPDALGKFVDAAEKEADEAARKTVEASIEVLQVYPPLPAGSHYKRTGRMGRSWKKIQTPRGWRIENYAQKKGKRYSQFVVGDAQGNKQAQVHQGRWKKFRDVVDAQFKLQCVQLQKVLKALALKHSKKG